MKLLPCVANGRDKSREGGREWGSRRVASATATAAAAAEAALAQSADDTPVSDTLRRLLHENIYKMK